ncbi:MAG TPA: choice-of-anchor J domain-containing protein [Bacteroidales bacterium]|nr:choice-of-anchor J domain-containing protein [Bacteroidales bacterium]
MKKLLYILILLIVGFSSCDPNEDIYKELDDLKQPYSGQVEYIFSTNDYEDAAAIAMAMAINEQDSTWAGYLEDFEAFNDSFPASEIVPHLLAGLFPAYNKNSVANVTYNYIADLPGDLAVYTTAEQYSFASDDYADVDSLVNITGYFYPEFNPDLYVPSILENNVTDAEDGDILIVSYKYSDVTPIINIVENTVILGEDFSTATAYETIDINGWTQYLEAGAETWEGRSYSGNLYAQFSARNTGDASNIAWLITPAIDLTEYTDVIFNFLSKDGYNNGDPLTVLISDDYTGTGDPNSATWVNLNPDLSTGNTSGYASSFTESGDISLNSYCGGTVYIAFKYSGGDGGITTTMQIDDVNVIALTQGFDIIGKNPITIRDYYTYEGDVWTKMEDVYYLNSADYDAMGAPGKYDNFSSDANPRDYLPNFLKAMYPLAGEGVVKTVVYKYYTGMVGTLTLADQYTYTAGQWQSLYNYIEETTEQYLHTGTEWIFDPTVRFTMSASDYQIIVDYVKAKVDPAFVDSYGTAEYYSGASSYYGNFDLRLSKRVQYDPDTYSSLSTEEGVALTLERLQDGIIILLQNKYPNAVPQVGGFDVHYFISYQTYNNDFSRTNFMVDYKCTAAASGSNPPQFELQDGYPMEQ